MAKKAEKAQTAADSYHNTNSREIILCEAAEGYLKSVLQKRFDPKKWSPISMWTEKRDNTLSERHELEKDYADLKAEVSAAEKIRSEVYSIMTRERRREQPPHTQGREL